MHSFSRDPNQVLLEATQKGYSRVLFQQGKPLLERELTLLGDLSNPQRLAEQYIGSGIPSGSDGFAIGGLNVAAAGNFEIKAGRCLVNGREVILGVNTTYRAQPRMQPASPFPAGTLNVYLRVFPTEITDVEDVDLKNTGDVGFVTAIREKTDWEVLISAPVINQPSHYLLATIDTVAKTVTDLRRKDLTVATLRDEMNVVRGNAVKLSDRVDASLTSVGAIKANAIANSQLADNSVTTNKIVDGNVIATKLAANAVNEVNLLNNSVSKRTIQDGAVSMAKMGLTLVLDSQVSVPASAAGQPGEAALTLQIADAHAFYLISVRQLTPRPQLPQPLGFVLNWTHRILVVKGPGLGNPYTHQHQVLVQNPTGIPMTVACKAFRIAET